jgi:hypothetical protein
MDFKCKEIDVNLDLSNFDTYAVVTPVKNLEIVEKNNK